MAKFLLVGHYDKNSGPDNVNRSLILHRDQDMDYIVSKNRIYKKIETIWKILNNNKIILSGCFSNTLYLLLRLFGKKFCILMHGNANFENKINQLGLSPKCLILEEKMLQHAEKIIAVSANYAEWIKKQYPQHASKIAFVNIGICLNPTDKHKNVREDKCLYTIAVSGGNRPQKRNLEVCKAVEKLNKSGWNIQILLFGREYPSGSDFSNYPFVHIQGHLDKEKYYKILHTTDAYVINSEVESFGLGIADAINCGCSLLLSKNVGALCIFDPTKLRDQDVIQDCQNIKEIALKISTILQAPNAKRISTAINAEQHSEKQAYLNLKMCIQK